MTNEKEDVYATLGIARDEAGVASKGRARPLRRALMLSAVVPSFMQLVYVAILILDGAQGKGSWGGLVGFFLFFLGVIPSAVANLVVTLIWSQQRAWVLIFRGVLIAIVVPILIVCSIN